jgi:hypothetical protein
MLLTAGGSVGLLPTHSATLLPQCSLAAVLIKQTHNPGGQTPPAMQPPPTAFGGPLTDSGPPSKNPNVNRVPDKWKLLEIMEMTQRH